MLRKIFEVFLGAPSGEWYKTDPDTFGGGRDKPYTEEEIAGRMCSRKGCPREAYSTWQACADNNIFRPLCAEHDIELNWTTLSWLGDPEWIEKSISYAKLVQSHVERQLENLWLEPSE